MGLNAIPDELGFTSPIFKSVCSEVEDTNTVRSLEEYSLMSGIEICPDSRLSPLSEVFDLSSALHFSTILF